LHGSSAVVVVVDVVAVIDVVVVVTAGAAVVVLLLVVVAGGAGVLVLAGGGGVEDVVVVFVVVVGGGGIGTMRRLEPRSFGRIARLCARGAGPGDCCGRGCSAGGVLTVDVITGLIGLLTAIAFAARVWCAALTAVCGRVGVAA